MFPFDDVIMISVCVSRICIWTGLENLVAEALLEQAYVICTSARTRWFLRVVLDTLITRYISILLIPQRVIMASYTSLTYRIRNLLDYLKRKYRVFMFYLSSDYCLFKHGYSQGTIKDREDLCEILGGIVNSLDGVKSAFEKWEPVRRDTIHLLNMYADQLDVCRKSKNYCRVVGSASGVLSSGCSIAGMALAVPTGGASMALGVAGGSIGFVSQVLYLGVDMHIRSKAEEQAKKDKDLTRELDEEVRELNLGIGRLGEWCSRESMIPIKCATIKDITGTGISVATAGSRVLLSGRKMYATKGISESNILRDSMIGLHVFFIVLDVVAIANTYEDIENGSKTKTGEHFRNCAGALEAERQEMRKIYDKIKDEGEVRDLKSEGIRKDEELKRQNEELKRQKEELASKDREIAELRRKLAEMMKTNDTPYPIN